MPNRRNLCVMSVALAGLTGASALGGMPDPDLVASDLGVTKVTIFQMPVDKTPSVPVAFDVPMGDEVLMLNLTPNSVRGVGYQVYHADAAGNLTPVPPSPVRTLKGSIAGLEGSHVRGGMMVEGLYAKVTMPDGEALWVEPISHRFPGADPDLYAVYNQRDTLPNGGTCGVDDGPVIGGAAQPNIPASFGGKFGAPPLARPVEDPAPNEGGLVFHITELALEADFQFFQDWQGGTENRMNLVINIVNNQYEDDVDITHVITGIIIRTSNADDPYSSNNASTLLGQFRNWWLANVPQSEIKRDVTHLFTGRNLNGGTIGIAFNIGVICSNQAYCLSQSDCCGSLTCATDLTAHELGHLWGAFHCGCPGFTMNPSITCANQFTSGSQNSINNEKNSVGCLDIGNPDIPANDNCINAGTPKIPGTYDLTNQNADTDGPFEAGDCDDIESDVWFRLGATETGIATLQTCGDTNFDTVILVYDGATCPTDANSAIACNDDIDCDGDGAINDDGGASRVTFPVEMGATYYVRIGGFNGDEGFGSFTWDIGAPPVPTNDDCADAGAPKLPGIFSVNNINASTDGPAEPGDCAIESDVWFLLGATQDGIATVQTCGSDFDTVIAAYTSSCPDGASALACNDDFDCDNNGNPNDDGGASRITFPVDAGSTYLLRIGGANGAEGLGTFAWVINDLPPPPDCPTDLTGDGTTDSADLNQVLANFGTNSPDGDADGDGDTDSVDLNLILQEFGNDCE